MENQNEKGKLGGENTNFFSVQRLAKLIQLVGSAHIAVPVQGTQACSYNHSHPAENIF
jgi:hypothetical protein